MCMTNQEAYLEEIDELKTKVDCLLSFVPAGKTAKEKKVYEEAEELAANIRMTLGCMSRDYIPVEM